MTFSRWLAAIAGLSLFVSIIWAGFIADAHLPTGFSAITAEPWGVVSLVDLYAGFILFAIVIALVERKWWVAALWIAPMPFLGNVVAAAWIVFRVGKLMDKAPSA